MANFCLYEDAAVGEICWRFDSANGVRKLYVMTIGVLPTYQRRGLGRFLLDHAISEAQKQQGVVEIYLHVHEENTAAQAFYERAGFQRKETETGYYKTLANGNAIVFSKSISPE
jgi:ribosomal protein S18 acetylase RimI-like enzyme